MSALSIRDARDADADAACEVMRRSITELCTEDHCGDAKVLTAWLRNKQPEVFRGWLARADNSLMVATEDERILAVGSVTDRGEVTLNYVSPDARFRGVSRALLAALSGARSSAATANAR